MTNITEQKRRKKTAKLSKIRISPPMVTPDAANKLDEIAELVGSSMPGLLAQLAECAKGGKPENWHRAAAAFQDAIEK